MPKEYEGTLNEFNLFPIFVNKYILIANNSIKQAIKFLVAYFSLDYVLRYFFVPYKKVDNIAGWFVGVIFKLIYLIFIGPLFMLTVIGLVVFWYGLPVIGFLFLLR